MNYPVLTDTDFVRLVNFVRQTAGINLEKKRTLIEARLTFDITRRGFTSFKDYLNTVTSNPDCDECQNMLNRLSTNYTYFFRESAALNFVADKFIPEFLTTDGKFVNIWCTACSSGEEPYSLAMMLEHTAQVRLGLLNYSILATDINTELLEKATVGSYPIKQLETIPESYRRYVSVQSDSFQIDKGIRAHISWKYNNLMNEVFLNQWNLILCRNVMIYFNSDTRTKLAESLWNALRPSGYLIIGTTENVDIGRKLFAYREPSIYTKRRTG